MKFKDMIDERTIARLATAVKEAHPTLDAERFTTRVFDERWADLELKARIRHIAHVVHAFLPDDYRTALTILRRAATRLEDYGFESMVFNDFVETYGLDDWEASAPALEQFTRMSRPSLRSAHSSGAIRNAR